MGRPLVRFLFAAALSLYSTWGAAFDGLRITLLSTGNSIAAVPDGFGPSILVEAGEEVLLFDCGRGSVQRLAQAGVPLRDITAVFLTSLEPGRVNGCADLWRARKPAADADPLPVWGPAGSIDLVNRYNESAGYSAPSDVLDVHEISENIAYQTADVTVTAIVADYPPVAQAYGYRVDYGGRAVVLSGDTRYSENMIRAARGVNVFIHEVAAASPTTLDSSAQIRAAVTTHTSPEEAGKVFRAARPYLAVYSPQLLFGISESELLRRTRRTYNGSLELGYDLMVIEVQNEVQIRSAPSSRRDAQ